MEAAALHSIEKLLQPGWSESHDLELKSARGGVPKSLWETYSAMANSDGGTILLGIEDNGSLSGIPDISKFKNNLWNTLNNRGKVSENLLTNQDITTIDEGKFTLLMIQVPRASRSQRPIFIGQNPLTGSYRRNHEGDYHCTEREVGRMLSDREESPADSRILEHYTMDDLDTASIQQYRNRFTSLKPDHPWAGESDLGFLTKLGAWRHERSNHSEGLTIAGLMMFGKEEALREALPQYHVDYREKLSDDPHVRWTDRIHMDGTWSGNLFQFYLRVIQKLSADLKIPFQLDNELFRKGETIIHEAIREALVNTLIHADYQGMGGIIIEKYRNRFELSNPGSLLVSMEQLFYGSVSECRNKTLQTMFMMLGAGEKAGSGIDKIHLGWESQHWRKPRVTEQVQPDRVHWMLPTVSLIPDESLDHLQQQFGSAYTHFSPLEIQALVTADLEKRVDNNRLQQITGAHSADLTVLLQSLVTKKTLVKKGHGRWSWYHLPEQPGSSVHNSDSSVHNSDSSVHNDDSSVHNNQTWEQLQQISQPARDKHRLPNSQVEQLITELCNQNWLTKRELGTLLERNTDGLRSRYLTPMVSQGKLKLRYPDTPNHQNQAYQAIVD
ncbi:MAG: hypothetical protein HN421_10710 [Gammaproteobacteria bacterium]|jgi:ATP-dependent DNA helicase RecG|nr:hypothetical protein [Gammaproteobacteria bacterium]MBT4606570.1 hypothetical protein [Thiotrichales bacterium]MBT3472045.1 hypothetical protein [Gammaproteobacteria bacterium]MBT3966901.1 hypothetical protein [Gammaproteobacteria bacterium]MBT4081220.1 hypothetical protein [Gammaproteobacteria bacterium]